MKSRNVVAMLTVWIALSAAPTSTNAQSALTGRVTNTATGQILEGARVELQGLGRVVTTDNEGEYRFPEVSSGPVTLSVSYTGLDTAVIPVSVTPGTINRRDVGLTAAIYRMSAFVVAGEREGNALAITLQRKSLGVKTVVSQDAYGSLAGNPADLLIRLPGVSGVSQDGDIRFVQIRGMSQNLSTVTRDGNRMADAASGGSTREYQFEQVNSDSIERFEVVKSPTPDMDADSIGGAVNMVSKSAFDRSPPGRRITFSMGAEWRALDEREKFPQRNYTFSYSEVLKDKLGVSFNYSQRKHLNLMNGTTNSHQNIVPDPAYTYGVSPLKDYRMSRTRWGGHLKLDYKLSDQTRFYGSSSLSNHDEHFNTIEAVFATAQTIATRDAAGNLTGTGAIVPGFTKNVTEWRPLAASMVTLNSDFSVKKGGALHSQIGAVHRFDGLDIGYDVYKSDSTTEYAPNVPGFEMIARGIGIRIDRTNTPFHLPAVIQTAGPDITNINSYAENRWSTGFREGKDGYWGAAINLKKDFATVVPTWIKGGLRVRHQTRDLRNEPWTGTYVGPDGVMGVNPATGRNDDNLAQFLLPKVERIGTFFDKYYETLRVPFASPPSQYSPSFGFHQPERNPGSVFESNPELFRRNIQADLISKLNNDQTFEERISAAYVTGNVELGKLTILGGVRVERTETEGGGVLQVITPEERARRAAFVGPLTDAEITRRTTAEYSGRRIAAGDYRTVFPGLHFKFEPRRNLLLRASYATNIGRPAIGQLIPRTTANNDSRTVSTSNPSLKPQYADNFDLAAEYYFEPIGMVSAGVFLKEMKNFIFTQGGFLIPTGADNGFGGEFAGYELTTQYNGGFARVRGFELSYQQQLTFLPGWWGGFGVYANYTRMETEGNYGTATVTSTSQVANFVPETGNLGISYIRKGVTARIQFTHRGRFLRSFSTSQARLSYWNAASTLNIKTAYQMSKRWDLYLDVNNVFNNPDRDWEFYGARAGRLEKMASPLFAFGVNGRL